MAAGQAEQHDASPGQRCCGGSYCSGSPDPDTNAGASAGAHLPVSQTPLLLLLSPRHSINESVTSSICLPFRSMRATLLPNGQMPQHLFQ